MTTNLETVSTRAFKQSQSVLDLACKMEDSTLGPSYLAYSWESRIAVRWLNMVSSRASRRCDQATDAGNEQAALDAAAEVAAILKAARAAARAGAPRDTDPDAPEKD
jgi:hypothetical protein